VGESFNGQEFKYTIVTGAMMLKGARTDREKEAEGEKRLFGQQLNCWPNNEIISQNPLGR